MSLTHGLEEYLKIKRGEMFRLVRFFIPIEGGEQPFFTQHTLVERGRQVPIAIRPSIRFLITTTRFFMWRN